MIALTIASAAIFSLLSACSKPAPVATEAVDASAAPAVETMRIVSVGGPVTEAIYAVGKGDAVVGVDTSSLFPEAATKLPKVGYQRTLAAEGLLALTPTLVVASGEAGPPAALDQLKNAGVKVELVAVEPTVEGAKERITKVAAIVHGDPAPAMKKLDEDLARLDAFVKKTTKKPKALVLYARGENALFVFGTKTAADSIVKLAGGENAVTAFEGSKELTSEAVVAAAPDVIVVTSRGLASVGGVAGLLKQPGVLQTPAGKAKRFVAVDDLLLLGFGPRTGEGALDLATKIHPEVVSPLADGGL